MVSSKAIQALVILLFIVVVLVGLGFLLSRELAPLLEEMEGSSMARPSAVTASTTPAPLVPATLTAMNQILAATVAPVTVSTTPTPTSTPVQALGTPVAPPLSADGGVTGTVNSSGVNLRSGPGMSYAVVGQAQEQSTVELTGRDAATLWWQICCPPGVPAPIWISAEFVDISMPKAQVLTLVPVVTSIAVPIERPTTSTP